MFCIIKGHENFGLAKIVDSEGKKSVIEYFDSPEKPRFTRTVANSLIVRKILGHNSRVYYNHPQTNQWLVGRVLQDYSDRLEVRFVSRNDVVLDYEHLFVRWKRPISDPTDFLANLITETPQYACARSLFLDSYIKQRGAVCGLSGLMSSVIELESHQINVIRRVLNDPSQRYLLADEVGLGKTIEAGVIIRQAVLDDPWGHKIVVLVPSGLVQQWRKELSQRFGLCDYLDESILVIPQEYSQEVDERLTGTNLLVIDEAHHLASIGNKDNELLYDLVSRISKTTPNLLLLSATPVLRNETGFLRMLHLLDPVIYNLSDEVSFRNRIRHRQSLAEAVAMLDPQNVFYLDSVLKDLLNILGNDDRLVELISVLQELLVKLPAEDDPALCSAIRLVRAHISETYRLHRRILRNRRKAVGGLTPERKGAVFLVAQESQLRSIESALEDWRINAHVSCKPNTSRGGKKEYQEFYWKAVASLLETPESLSALCRNRMICIGKSSGEHSHSFHNEDIYLKEITACIDIEEWLNIRLACLSDGIRELLNTQTKIVVFCSDSKIADKVFFHLHSLNPLVVIRHKAISDIDEDVDETTERFLADRSIRVLVCDCAAEEGINLQGGEKTIIHFDLPIEPNRIEQRMGRVDRYGAGSPVQSVVLIDNSSKYQKAWYDIVRNALGVFNQSISSLQYLVEDELQQLRMSLFDQGIEAMSGLSVRLSGSTGTVAKELKLIDQQDSLDELTPLSENDTEDILDIDCQWREIRDSVFGWVVDTLMFRHIREKVSTTANSIDPPFRFQYHSPSGGGVATLIPLLGFIEGFSGVIDFSPRHSNSHTPLTYPHASHRTTAVKRGVRILRYGDEFIEAVKSFSDIDDRGRSYAMWRQLYFGLNDDNPHICFRFNFLIETRLADVKKVLDGVSFKGNQSARSAISRRGDALFPPYVEHVWVDEDGEELDHEFIDNYLRPPYAKEGVEGHYIDTNIKLYRFIFLKKAMPDKFDNWKYLCERLRDKACSILVQRKEFSDRKNMAMKRAQIGDEIRYAQLATRIRHLQEDEAKVEREQLELEKKLNNALYIGIQSPTIKVDVAGVVFLSRLPFSNIQQAAEEQT